MHCDDLAYILCVFFVFSVAQCYAEITSMRAFDSSTQYIYKLFCQKAYFHSASHMHAYYAMTILNNGLLHAEDICQVQICTIMICRAPYGAGTNVHNHDCT